jgi:DNA-binding response OmpR family regulator
MRVLFADDQIPHADAAQNELCKAELRREVGAQVPDFEQAYAEDFKWFSELVQHLRTEMGFTLLLCPSFAQARQAASDRQSYDIAVVDLSWNGDPGLPPGQRRNVGLDIIRKISADNRSTQTYKPVIAFSQNFKGSPELFAHVLEAEALPMLKDYSPTGHRTLAAAIKLLGRTSAANTAGKAVDWEKLTVAQLAQTLKPSQLWGVLAALAGTLSSVAALAFWLGTKLK